MLFTVLGVLLGCFWLRFLLLKRISYFSSLGLLKRNSLLVGPVLWNRLPQLDLGHVHRLPYFDVLINNVLYKLIDASIQNFE